jgi:hypothetical protein
MITGFANLTLVLPFRTPTEEGAQPEGAGHNNDCVGTTLSVRSPFLLLFCKYKNVKIKIKLYLAIN